MIKIDELAPEFSLPQSDGELFTLSKYRGKNVVLFFYPKNFTPGCTKEACGFRNEYSEFKKFNAEVVGISSDSGSSHSRFSAKFALPFPLLSDSDGLVAKLYGVKKTFGIFAGRASFVIDAAGVLKFQLSSQVDAERHVTDTLAALKILAPQ